MTPSWAETILMAGPPILIRCEVKTLRDIGVMSMAYKISLMSIRAEHDGRDRPLTQQGRRRLRAHPPAILERLARGRLTLAQYVLAAELGISITPLREAVRRLSGEGLIVLDAHRNARVAGWTPTRPASCFETRRALDPAAIALAGERRTDADIARMQEALTRLLARHPAVGRGRPVAHREVHQAIYSPRTTRAHPAARRPLGQVRPLPPRRPPAAARARSPAPATSRSTAAGRARRRR